MLNWHSETASYFLSFLSLKEGFSSNRKASSLLTFHPSTAQPCPEEHGSQSQPDSLVPSIGHGTASATQHKQANRWQVMWGGVLVLLSSWRRRGEGSNSHPASRPPTARHCLHSQTLPFPIQQLSPGWNPGPVRSNRLCPHLWTEQAIPELQDQTAWVWLCPYYKALKSKCGAFVFLRP